MPLIGLILVVISLALFLLETAAYLAFVKWYYRLGPPIRNARWQLQGDVASVCAAIQGALPIPKLKCKRRGETFLFRFRWWDASVWSRVVLRVEATSHGAALGYEVRPFISPALVALSILLFFQWMQIFTVAYLLLVIAMYVVGLWWDLRKINLLEPLGTQLAQFGLSICPQCGYDRFGIALDGACPECGAIVSSASN